MGSKKNTIEDFVNRFKPQFEEFIQNGGDINTLTRKDKLFAEAFNFNLLDENGNKYGIDEKFKILGIERKVKVVKDVKQSLIDAIEEYKEQGGNFHIQRKKLPFYSKILIYSNYLQRNNIFMSPEEIMHSLGYYNYSELYYKCSRLQELKQYEDQEGYIDSYHNDVNYAAYINNIATLIDIPLYILITLLLDKKTKKYAIQVDYINYVKTQLTKHAKTYGTLKGLSNIDTELYNRFDYLVKNFADGAETNFSKQEWLAAFGLRDYENDFKTSEIKDINISELMQNLKAKFGDHVVMKKDIDIASYNIILKKSIQMGIQVGELFKAYDINYQGLNNDRLSMIYIEDIPYLQDMKKRREELVKESKISLKNGYCKEQVFLERIRICQQVYNEFKTLIQEDLIGNQPTFNMEELSSGFEL